MDRRVTPTFLYGGPAKSGSAWLYEALCEHPEIYMPDIKPVSYFNLKYHQGPDWYAKVFAGHDSEPVVGDCSPGYLYSEQAPERVADVAPDAKVVFTLRNPIDRAYSEWWHNNRSGWLNVDFEDVFYIHQAYQILIRPGFYDRHLRRWERHLPEDNVRVFLFDDFVADNAAFARDVFEFVGADPGYNLSIVGERVNRAQSSAPALYEEAKSWLVHNAPEPVKALLRPAHAVTRRVLESRAEYKEGMNENVREQLEVVYAPEMKRLSERIDRDLDHWFEYVDLDADDYWSQVDVDDSHKRTTRNWTTTHNETKNYRKRRT